MDYSSQPRQGTSKDGAMMFGSVSEREASSLIGVRMKGAAKVRSESGMRLEKSATKINPMPKSVIQFLDSTPSLNSRQTACSPSLNSTPHPSTSATSLQSSTTSFPPSETSSVNGPHNTPVPPSSSHAPSSFSNGHPPGSEPPASSANASTSQSQQDLSHTESTETLHHTPPAPSSLLSSSRSTRPPSPAYDGSLRLVDAPPSLLSQSYIPGVTFSTSLRPPRTARIPNIPRVLPPRPPSPPTPVTLTPSVSASMSRPLSPVSTETATTAKTEVSIQAKKPPASWADLVRRQQAGPTSTGASPVPNEQQDVKSSGAVPKSPTSKVNGVTNTSTGVNVVPFSVSVDGFEGHAAISLSNGKSETLEVQLASIENTLTAPIVHPRGLINNGNLCFANSILQVLVYCPPFYSLLQVLGRETAMDFARRTPTMDAMVVFLQEFKPIAKGEIAQSRSKARQNANKPTVTSSKDDAFLLFPPATPEWTEPFVPEIVYESMKGNKRFDAMRRGTQEDAQEFLGFFLDTLHEEISLAIEQHDKPWKIAEEDVKMQKEAEKEGDDEEWMEVGVKGRTAVTRTTEAKESPITRIFGGKIRSVVRCPGQKDSVTLEPYLTLQLDIQPESVFTISDALTNFHEPEIITGLTNAKGAKVDGTKQVFIETLPHVLVLHLKRFLYDKEGGAMKSGKIIGYDTELEIPKSVLSPAKKGKTAARYQLFGVIYHHGRSTAGGHYTAAVRQPASPHQWINIDDTLIRPMDVKEVAIKVDHNSAHAHEDRWGSTEKNAYLLFYLRVA